MSRQLVFNPFTTNFDYIDVSAGGGTILAFETPIGAVDDSNTTFTVSNTPLFISVNGGVYDANDGIFSSYSLGTITLSSAVGVGGFITSAYTSSTLAGETPVGAVDDSNTIFTVSNTPLFIVVNGAVYISGTGIFTSYVNGTITLSTPVGVGGFITSIHA